MTKSKTAIARACLDAAEQNTLSFPEIVKTLMDAGFESYCVDFRRARAVYYTADGDSVDLPTHRTEGEVAPAFDVARLQGAIREAQQLVPGYTYQGFCRTAVAAGCAGYTVSFLGRRAVYMGRTGETHVEQFRR